MRTMLFSFFVVCVALALPADAGTCDLTEYPASGVLTSERLNQRLRQTEACVNGNIGTGNWNSSEPLANANLANPNAIYSQSFVISGSGYGGGAGADVTATAGWAMWKVPVSSTVIGMTVSLHGCAGCSLNVTLQKDTTTIKTFAAITAAGTVSSDFTLSNAVTNAQELNIDLAGTVTGVKAVDVVVYLKAAHQT